MNSQFAADFAAEWIAAWNTHDLERVLAHYAEDFEMTSPYIAQIAGEPSCALKGKAAVGAYWRKALGMMPELRFELVAVLAGVNSLVLHYKGAQNKQVAEIFYFDEAGKVIRASAHYA